MRRAAAWCWSTTTAPDLLASLLTGDPFPELGNDVRPLAVRFQASAMSPVDDLVISGRAPDGVQRKASVGVRRAPHLVSSETASLHLLASYLRVVISSWDEVPVLPPRDGGTR